MRSKLKPMDSAALQQARQQAKQRYIEIAVAETPDEVRVIVPRRSLTGYAEALRSGGYKLVAPRPFTRQALYIYLHECAHIALRHIGPGRRLAHREEFEAERWAHETMRKHGVVVPRKITDEAKDYVASKIHEALRGGAKKIDPEAARFAGVEVPAPTPARPQTITTTFAPEELQLLDELRRQRRRHAQVRLSREQALHEVLGMVALNF